VVKVFVGCAASAVIAAIALAPAALADGDADCVEQLGVYGIHGDANSIGWGHRICNRVSQGVAPLAEAQELRENSPQLTQQQAEGEVNAAIMSYCESVLLGGVELIQI
jgi:Protein of unknown function (DUF732)